jgi:uroporphyrinogen decarboxylase
MRHERYSEKENFLRTIRRDSPSHVCFPPPSQGLSYHGAWPGDLRPDAACLKWLDIWGVTWEVVEGEAFPIRPPIGSIADLGQLRRPDPHAPIIRERLATALAGIDRERFFVSVNHPYFLYEKGFNLLGAEEFLASLAQDEAAGERLLDAILEFELGVAEEYVRCRPDHINTMDDYGMQQGLAVSPEMWRRLFKPRLRRLYDFYRRELGPEIVISHHSCGHVMPILEDFIDLGVDILNPLQTTANDLPEAARITRGRLVIAGAIDGQQILPFGTPAEVRTEVFRKLDLFWDGGGYLPMAEKMLGVPEENRRAMEDAILEWSRIHVE